ncbi:MAG: hypothetical protein RIF41_19055 [Polyangiaceae bacterium]
MTKRPDPWTASPDDSQQVTAQPLPAPVPEPEGIEAVHAQFDRLRPILRRMRRHWLWGLPGILIATLLVGGYAMLVFNPPFESETVVFYQPDISPESLGQDTDRVDPTFMRELLLRRGRLEELIRELELHQSTVKKYGIGVAVEEMQRLVSFTPVGKSTFRIAYIGDSPEEARDVTAWLADQLVEEELDRRQKQALDSKVFLDKELERVTKDLAKLEKELGDFIARHPRFATTNNDTARENRQNPAASPSPRRPTGRRPKAPTPAPVAAPAAPPAPDPKLVAEREAAIQELTRASRALAELQSQYTDAHPDVGPAKARVAAAEQKVEAATKAIQASTADDLYAVAEKPPPAPAGSEDPEPAPRPRPRARPAPKADPEPSPDELAELPPEELGEVETEWMRLKRAVDEAHQQQSRLAAESFRAEVQSRSRSAGHSARVVILDEAYLPSKPLRSRLFFGKIWAPFAAILAVGLVLGRALLDDRVYDTDDLANLGMKPLLSVIPSHASSDG